jgi:hypothetical protein
VHVPREVTHSREFDAALAALGTHPRIDEFVDGAIWEIGRGPGLGRHVPGTDVWYVVTVDSAAVPDRLILFYTFDDTEILLLDVQILN